ncbi:hypothetical protein E4U15_005152 [Claviceps sp. LM218 group G6]|nr:hypothetical protein E4U15_005152 [Claviceps sp. LM218 group G6]
MPDAGSTLEARCCVLMLDQQEDGYVRSSSSSSSRRKGTTMGNAESANADSQPGPTRMERKSSEACLSTAAKELSECKDDARRGARRGGSTTELRKR